MNWAKLDAGLAAAMEAGRPAGRAGRAGRARTLRVFVHVDPSGADADPDLCDRLGVGPPNAGAEIRTATLSLDQVAELSELPWVSKLALADHIRLLDDDPR